MTDNPAPVVRTRSRPRLLTLNADPEERHASWLELFFDLVFVLAVAQVAQVLVKDSSLTGFVKYLVLFVPVWWTWVGFTFYADRFESDEIPYRVLTFSAMLGVAALSLTLGGAFTPEGDLPLIAALALVRLILIGLYLRVAYHVPLARAYAYQYVGGLGAAILIFFASFMFDPPVRYYVWAAAILLELVTPFLNLRQARTIPYDYSHIPERFGLFTIIVLGEAVIATATGASLVNWTPATIAMASIGFAMAACVWWINFEFVEDYAIKRRELLPRIVYLYGHYFIVASIVALGIGVEHAIKETADDHLHLPALALMGGGIATYSAAITVIKIAGGVCRLLPMRIATMVLSLGMIYAGLHLPPLVVGSIFLLILVLGVWLEGHFAEVREHAETSSLTPCEHSAGASVFKPRSFDGCEECLKNNYKWVHLRLCLECGHVGCCDSSRHKHATKHFHKENHAIMASLEEGEHWAWCYADERFVPLSKRVVNKPSEHIELSHTNK